MDKVLTEAYARLTAIEESDRVPEEGDTVEHLKSGKIFYVDSILDDGTYSLVDFDTDDGIEVPRRAISAYKIYEDEVTEDKALERAKAAQKNRKNTFLGWYTTDENGKGYIGSVAGKPKRIKEDGDDVMDGIEEFTGIQDELFELIERLDSAIRAYAPNQHRYWQAYGLAHLKVIAGSDEYASDDESLSKLIQNLQDELENDRDQHGERPERYR